MGCDGGTIPKRNEIVKNKQHNQARDKGADRAAKWQYCSLSGLKLKKPIVACQLGRLYNKDAIIEHLLNNRSTTTSSSTKSAASSTAPAPASSSTSSSTSSNATQSTNSISHIRSLKDVKELKLIERHDSDKASSVSSTTDNFKAPFVCPISGLELTGKYKFYYLLTCGCVFSERALREVPNEQRCISCSRLYDPEMDLIVLNGDEEEIEELKRRISARRREKLKASKRPNAIESDSTKRHKTEATEPSSTTVSG